MNGTSDKAARSAATLLAIARIGIGASVWIAPRPSMRGLGFDPDNPQVMSLARLAGTRDLALGGAAAACAGDPGASATMARLNAGVDALDAAAFGIALVRRRGINRAAAMGTVTAAAATLIGLAVASRLDRASHA